MDCLTEDVGTDLSENLCRSSSVSLWLIVSEFYTKDMQAASNFTWTSGETIMSNFACKRNDCCVLSKLQSRFIIFFFLVLIAAYAWAFPVTTQNSDLIAKRGRKFDVPHPWVSCGSPQKGCAGLNSGLARFLIDFLRQSRLKVTCPRKCGNLYWYRRFKDLWLCARLMRSLVQKSGIIVLEEARLGNRSGFTVRKPVFDARIDFTRKIF